MPRTYLLTGFPGFLAGRLVPRLLEDDDEARIVALVEPRMVARARRWRPTASTSSPATSPTPRSAWTRGPTTRLTAEVVKVFHLAAVYDLAVGDELAERVNVEGTQHVLDFCAQAHQLGAPPLHLDRLRRGPALGLRPRGRPRQGPDVQELLRVHQVRRRGPRPGDDGHDPDDDLPPGDRGRRLADRRDAEVRRPLLPAAHATSPPRARCCRSAAATRRSTWSRSTSSSTRSPRARATTRRSATRCTSSTPSRSPRTSWRACWPSSTRARSRSCRCRPASSTAR